MACELFAADNRTFAGMIIENFWAVAMCFLALLAYLVQNWVHLQLIISLFGLLTIPLYWRVVHTHKNTVSNAHPRSTLTRQISFECVHCVGFR